MSPATSTPVVSLREVSKIYGEGDASSQFKEKLQAGVLFPRRLGRADEFATLAIEMLANSYMNAESVRLDGGIRMPPK